MLSKALSIHWLRFLKSESRSVMSDSATHGLYSPWNSLGQNVGMGSLFLTPGDLPNPRIKPRSPTLQADSLPSEPPGKPKNTGVGSLSLLQGIFLMSGWNPGVLPCRQILDHLSHQGIQHDDEQFQTHTHLRSQGPLQPALYLLNFLAMMCHSSRNVREVKSGS